MKKWLSIGALLAFTSAGFFAWKVAGYGLVRSYLLGLGLSGLIFLVLAIWLVVLKIQRKGGLALSWKWQVPLYVLSAVSFGGLVAYEAIPYHGALSWKLEEWLNDYSVPFEKANLYDNGLDGIGEALGRLGLDRDSLSFSSFQLDFAEDGTIQSLEAYVYGRDAKRQLQAYSLIFDRSKSLYLHASHGTVGSGTNPLALTDFERILQAVPTRSVIASWATSGKEPTYVWTYEGKQTLTNWSKVVLLGNTSQVLNELGQVSGPMVSLSMAGREDSYQRRYLLDPSYKSAQTLNKEAREATIEKSKEGSWSVDRNDGSIYATVADSGSLYRLRVVSAASGSRWYVLDKSMDDGQNWQKLVDPFANQGGVAEGLVFVNDQIGFAGLQNPGGERSKLYWTQDGGQSFTEVQLPLDQVTSWSDKAYAQSIRDFDYMGMPKEEAGQLKILVTTASTESVGLTFVSTDQGRSWTYVKR